MFSRYLRTITVFSLIGSSLGFTQSYTPGNLAVLRVGDGIEILTNSGNTLFIDQFTTGGALVNSATVPDNGTAALIISGTAGSEGGLTRSMDRSQLIFAGYHVNRASVSGSLSSQSAAAVPRGVASVDAFGAYQLAEASTTLYSSNNIRGAVSDGTNRFWTAGSRGGTYFLQPPQTTVDLEPGGGNTRQVKIINGQLYFSTQAGTAGLYMFNTPGLPVAASNPVLVLATGTNTQPAGFSLNRGLGLAYVADQRPNAGGIQKWTNNGTAWRFAYAFSTGAGAFDVAVNFNGSAPIIYATTAESSGNRLISITDTGPLSIVKQLAVAGSSRIFRGLDFVPDLRPLIVAQPQSQIVGNGRDVSFSVIAQSHYALQYQWQKNGTDLIGATTAGLTLLGVSSSDQGTYRVVVTNDYGSATSLGADLTVEAVLTPPAITAQPVGQSVPLGGNTTFSVAANGSSPLAYQWQFNGIDIASQTNTSLAILNAGPSDQGSYSVRVYNGAGTTNSQPAVLTVISPEPSFAAYTSATSTYFQDFNSLPDPGAASVNANNPVTIAGVTYGLANPFDFSYPILPNSVQQSSGVGLGGLGLSNSMAGWYARGDLAPKFGASSGDQSTGGVVSFGPTNGFSGNRALGLLSTSSTGPTEFGLKLLNQTPGILGAITVHVTGELWRQAAVPKSLVASYWIDATGTNTLGTNFTAALSGLDVSFLPDANTTNPVPVDGTLQVNQVSIGITNQPISAWSPGAALWLFWRMNDATGKGQGLAIDDLSFSASGSQSTGASLAIQVSGGNVVLSWPATLSGYQLQTSSNLKQPGGWGPVPQPIVQNNGSNTVTVPINGANQFYRLRQ